jgi:L-Ala-D/L-Glu epimerase
LKALMRIRRIDLYLNRHPFRFAFISLHTQHRQANSVLLRMETDTGVVGWGESTPREYVTGETCESVCSVIEGLFAEPLFSAEIASTAQVMHLLSTLAERKVSARTQMSPSSGGTTAALGAVDLALWDAWGQICGQAAYRFFTAEPLALPPLSLSVPILPLEQIRSLHPLAGKLGISCFKLVLSADVEENVARLALLRQLVGNQATVTADANGKLTVEQIQTMLPALAVFKLAAIEQPAPKADLEGFQRLRSSLALPIALGLKITADESVCTLADARRLIDLRVCDALNLKISKCGGLLATQKIHTLARRHGIGCQLGSHVGETPILAAGGHAAARFLPDLSFMEIGSAFLEPYPALGQQKAPQPETAPGLGLSIDTDAVTAHFGSPVVTLRP